MVTMVLSFHHHSHRENVTAPTGRPNIRSRLHFNHSRVGGGTTKSERTCGGIGGRKRKNKEKNYLLGTGMLQQLRPTKNGHKKEQFA